MDKNIFYSTASDLRQQLWTWEKICIGIEEESHNSKLTAIFPFSPTTLNNCSTSIFCSYSLWENVTIVHNYCPVLLLLCFTREVLPSSCTLFMIKLKFPKLLLYLTGELLPFFLSSLHKNEFAFKKIVKIFPVIALVPYLVSFHLWFALLMKFNCLNIYYLLFDC